MRIAALALPLAALAYAVAAPGAARAETCFRACVSAHVKASDVTDEMIRHQMGSCRDSCEEESRARLVSKGLDKKVAACEPQRLSDAEFKVLRAASASFFTYANAFTWDIHNVLPGRVIRKVEIVYPTLDLDDTTATGGGIILPGETETILINATFDGYPATRYALRVRAVYACPVD